MSGYIKMIQQMESPISGNGSLFMAIATGSLGDGRISVIFQPDSSLIIEAIEDITGFDDSQKTLQIQPYVSAAVLYASKSCQ